MTEGNPSARLLPSLITTQTRGLLVLHHLGKSKSDAESPPYMRGYIETIDGRIKVDAFKEEDASKRTYLRLVIGNDGHEPALGALYREETHIEGVGWVISEKTQYKRTGTIDVDGGVLQIIGTLRLSKAIGVPFIRAKVLPMSGSQSIDLTKYF